MKTKYLLILLTLVLLNGINAQISYNYKLYTTEDGMLSNRSISLFQDSKGYLWVSHISGLSKFNGKSFEKIIDKGFGRFWQINDLVENDKKEILCSSDDFVFNPITNKYIVKDSVFCHFIEDNHKEWGVQNRDAFLDKNFYRIYSLDEKSHLVKDTLFFSKDGKFNSVTIPKEKNNLFNGLIKDQNNNVYLNMIDSITKFCSYYLFKEGKLMFLLKTKEDAFKVERDLKNNIILFSDGEMHCQLSIYSINNKLIDKLLFEPLNQDRHLFDCIIDSSNNLWVPSRKGVIKFNSNNGFKEFVDNDRNIDISVVEEYDAMGNPYNLARINDGNYCHLILDKNGYLINGDRTFNGVGFSDLLPYLLYPKFMLNNYTTKNKELRRIYDMLCDRENNIWMVTDDGLIKFTQVPYLSQQLYLSKSELDFELKHTDKSGRKFFVKTDDLSRIFHLKVYKDTSLLFTKTYKKSPLSSTKNGLVEIMDFYSFGKNTVMHYNSENLDYNLCFFEDTEIKKFNFKYYFGKIYIDSLNMIFKEFNTGVLFFINNKLKIEKRIYPKIAIPGYNYGSNFRFSFKNGNKILGNNLIIYRVKPDLELDSFSFGNLPIKVRYNLKKVIDFKALNYDLFIVDNEMNYYFVNENTHVKLKIDNKNSLNRAINNSEYNLKVLFIKDLLFYSNGSELIMFKIDTVNFALKHLKDFNYENGLMNINDNQFFTYNNYLILHSSGTPYISLFSYENILNNGLNSPINIKVTRWEDFVVSDPKRYLNNSFFNNQPPIININSIYFSKKGEILSDSINSIHNYSSSISNLTFNYDAVSLTEGDYIQTKYNVVGFDTTWQTINSNEIKFSSLPPGSYTLQIKACNNHNFWSEPKQLAFSIDFPWYRTWLAYILYLIIGGGSIYLFIKSRTRKLEIEKEKLEKIVDERTAEVVEEKKVITEQKHLIEEKHREITDSINYAERIQRSFLATKEQLDEKLKDYFVLFQPKDVVSGDFYWAHTSQNGNFALVTADSTGHGVPGAIMSLLNTSSLEKAVELGINEPAEILNHTRQTIIQRLKKDGSAEGGKDGMDCSLISFNKDKNKLIYSAANNPVWIIRNNELIELSPDKIPVGKHDRDSISFTQHEVDIQKGDMIYTLTDGFPDQFGGPKGKKFMYKKLKELLMTIAHKPTSEQQKFLKDTLSGWMVNTEQVDDITIIGVRV